MRKIAVVGAGQAGLLLSLGLLERGYRVTLVADRTPDQVLHGQVPAGAVVFGECLALERELGVNFWDDEALFCKIAHLDLVGPDGKLALSIEAPLDQPALCVDQRLKCFRWLHEVERRGGRLVIQTAAVEDLEPLSREHDLVVVAAGRGDIAKLFARDDARSPFTTAARHISMVVVSGATPWSNFAGPGPKFTILPGLGEIFCAPLYATGGVQAIFLGFEAVPGGPIDRFTPGMEPDAQLALAKQVFRDLLPWDHDAIASTVLIDRRAHLHGRIVPTVRKPVATLPSGARVVGIADTVNVHDPVAAQGANNAAKAARTFIRRIAEHGGEPFDARWMEDVSDEVWRETRHGNRLAEILLAPPEPHVIEVMITAAHRPEVARRFINGFANPAELIPWLSDPVEARRYLGSFGPPPPPPA